MLVNKVKPQLSFKKEGEMVTVTETLTKPMTREELQQELSSCMRMSEMLINQFNNIKKQYDDNMARINDINAALDLLGTAADLTL